MGRRKSFNVTHNDSPQCCHPGEPTHPEKPASVPGGRGDDPVAIYLGKENPQGTEKCKPTGGDKPSKPARPQLPLLQLFRYATPFDWLLMVVASLSSVVHGACLILLMFMFGKVVDVFLDDAHHKAALHAVNWSRHNHTLDTARANRSVFLSILHAENATDLEHLYDRQMEGLLDHTASYTYLLVGSGVAVLVTAYLQVALWFRSSNRQGYRMREALFRSIMKQDIGWFDTHKSGQLNTRLAGDIDKIVEGIGDKIGHFLQWTTVAVCGLLMGFIHGWQLALLVSTCVPVVSISLACMGKKLREFMPKETEAYAAAGSIAEQVFVAVRTVMAFGGEDKETERYTKNLYSARRLAIRKGFLTGTGPAVSVIVIYVMYAVAFWVGSVLIKDGQMTPGQLVSVFYGMIMGAFAVGLAIPHTQGISEAKAVAYELWTIIDTVPSVDWTSSGGLKPTQCRGEVTFDNVQFAYPSRSNKNVLESVSMHAAPGSTVALVGASGCGKSTVVQLIQRFYDVTKGTVSIDGHDVRQLNVQWVRQHIGLVSQEPVLFGTTIEENIRFGEQGVTHQQIDDACRKANAYDFIQQLPDKYKTLVGERGTQLSGGQKQRIAIARALVREPKILLLDEATSALDTSSEAVVQEALDKAREGRTTIMIAHRLCTVRNADTIYGIRDGAVVESGNHEELVTIEDGVYSTMLNKQEVKLDLDIHTKTTTCASNGAVAANAQQQTPHSKKQTTTNNTTKSSPSPLWWILKQNRPELLYIALGSVGAFVHGMKQPLLALVFSQMFNVFEGPESAYYPDIHLYASLFLALGLLTGLAIIAQNYYFAHAGAYLTERIRIKMFKKYLSMDVSFFDQPGNHSGVIVNKLVNTPKIMQGATGTQLGFLLQSLAGLGCGLAVAFYYSWKMTVGVVGFVPIMFAGGIITQKLLTGASKEGRDSRAQASTIGVQAIRNIRTVTSLSMQDWFTDAYLTNMRKPYREGIRNAVIHGALYSFTQSCLHFAFAASFAFGAHLVDQGEITFVDMLRVFMGIVFGAMSLGNAAKFVPNYVQSKAASQYLHDLFTSQSTINNNLDTGIKPKTIEGSLQFHGVSFSYPSRQTVPVLQDCSIHVAPGETVALVGTSGCGKTTCVQLMERFYDPTQGDIRLDGVPLTDLSVRWLRAQLGLVAQEPVLFDATIADNIAYGDNSKQVQMCDIIQAAKTANIHEFIAQLPEGYNTHCGVKGTQLSGGQKQRIAIARALIRDPKVLLLDEATSALDTDSEKSVQEALERAQRGRTSLVIAHRLSTIVNADKIVVFQQGRIVEAGTHAQLLAQQGVYYQLNKAQVS